MTEKTEKFQCVALEWGLDDEEQQKDYVPCDATDAEPCLLVGLLIGVQCNLCDAHKRYFISQPKGWGLVIVYDAKTLRRIDRWGNYGSLYLSAETIGQEEAARIGG